MSDGDSPAHPPARSPSSAFALALVGALVIAGLSFFASLKVGPTHVTLADVATSLVGFNPSVDAHVVARDVRLPRALLALIVGGSLAAAGAVMQGVTRNPLAGPTIMGLSGGGSLAALVALIAFPGLSYNGAIAASLVGAAAGYSCVLLVACAVPGGFSPTRLTLAGAVTSALFGAFSQGLVIAMAMASDLLYWTVGGIANVTWPQVAAVAPFALVGLAGVLWIAPGVTILSLGSDVAAGLGQRPARVRVAASLCVLLLTGAAVGVAGPVAFVGLMAPHICRMAAGADYRRIVPLSFVVGAALTTASDLLARTALGDGGEVPLGVVTALLGAPAFVWLVRTRGRRRIEGGTPHSAASPHATRPASRVLPALALVLLVVAAVAAQIGDASLSPTQLGLAVVGQGTPEAELVLWSFRLPRIAFAVLVGAGIGVSGALLQGVLRNDLAEPGILGVAAGSSLAIILTLWALGPTVLASLWIMPLAAVFGALAAMAAVCLLCVDQEHSSPRLLLTGVAVSSALGAIGLVASLQISSEAYAFAVAFSAGSLGSADWNYVVTLLVVVGALVPLTWSLSLTLNVLRLGEAQAAGLGVPVVSTTFLLLGLAVALCATCMALAGGVLFLGLLAPHIARRLVGADHAGAIPAAALVGAVLLLVADVLGGKVLPEAEVPAGVMVSALGAPYFLYLMTRT